MRHNASVLFVILPLKLLALGVMTGAVGCNQTASSPEQRLLGKWQGTLQIDGDLASDTLTPEQITAIQGATMLVEFQNNGKLNLGVTGQPAQASGTWELLSADENCITIVSTEADGKSTDLELHFQEDNVFSMPLPGPLAKAGLMEFRRLR
ncbi:MAG TPA: hypothetical protein DCY79_15960 [Planctomycetaceae bacterium]|nr:hypothetical protein [Blastopirellula sp.]HAY81299.1 hypothetical protein [Planctomycetaceae bacterium]|tara:strand:- start:366 stop:818 length:453 start_codon:yes stop_codon:yes gene_type:complete